MFDPGARTRQMRTCHETCLRFHFPVGGVVCPGAHRPSDERRDSQACLRTYAFRDIAAFVREWTNARRTSFQGQRINRAGPAKMPLPARRWCVRWRRGRANVANLIRSVARPGCVLAEGGFRTRAGRVSREPDGLIHCRHVPFRQRRLAHGNRQPTGRAIRSSMESKAETASIASQDKFAPAARKAPIVGSPAAMPAFRRRAACPVSASSAAPSSR